MTRRFFLILTLIFSLLLMTDFSYSKKSTKGISGVKIKGKVAFFFAGSWNSSRVQVTGNTVLPKGTESYEFNATALEGSGKLYSIRIKKERYPDVNIGVVLYLNGSEIVREFLNDLKDGGKNDQFRTIINQSVKSRSYILEFLKPVPYTTDVKMKLLLDDTKETSIEAVLYYKSN